MPAICAELFRRKFDLEKRKDFRLDIEATLVEVQGTKIVDLLSSTPAFQSTLKNGVTGDVLVLVDSPSSSSVTVKSSAMLEKARPQMPYQPLPLKKASCPVEAAVMAARYVSAWASPWPTVLSK